MIGGMVCIGFPIPEKVVYAYWEKKINCICKELWKKTMKLNQINFNVKGQHFNIADCLEK